MKIKTNINLSQYSTMRVGGTADHFATITSHDDLKEAIAFLRQNPMNHMILGEGSNTVFVGDFKGLILKNEIHGIEEVERTETHVTLRVGGGVVWHDFVKYCVDHNLAGNENLAYIPGTVGAAPVQNIAAYGQVQEDTFLRAEAVDMKTGEITLFEEPACEFGYRTSVFKTKFKDQYCITHVTYQLKIAEEYVPETSYYSRYESLDQFLPEDKSKITLIDIFNAVIALRKHKLPQVDEVGTVGSFFINPFVTKQKLEELQKQFPGIQFYPVDKMQYPGLDDEIFKDAEIFKIPVGWLLEELGWRGKTEGPVGTSPKHSLCIVVNAPATGNDVVVFYKEIVGDVLEKTGIQLETEVNIVG